MVKGRSEPECRLLRTLWCRRLTEWPSNGWEHPLRCRPSSVALNVFATRCVEPFSSLCLKCICGCSCCGVYIVYSSLCLLLWWYFILLLKRLPFHSCSVMLLFAGTAVSTALFIYFWSFVFIFGSFLVNCSDSTKGGWCIITIISPSKQMELIVDLDIRAQCRDVAFLLTSVMQVNEYERSIIWF